MNLRCLSKKSPFETPTLPKVLVRGISGRMQARPEILGKFEFSRYLKREVNSHSYSNQYKHDIDKIDVK